MIKLEYQPDIVGQASHTNPKTTPAAINKTLPATQAIT